MLIWTLFLFWFVEFVPQFVPTFQLHPVRVYVVLLTLFWTLPIT
jgi:hypothetical protein